MSWNRSLFGRINGKEIYRYTFENSGGMKISVINYGGIVTDLWVPDSSGRLRNVVLGFDTLDEYIEDTAYIGALIGRFANRIKNGVFFLDGREYILGRNERGKHHLHGGFKGFNRVIWREVEVGGDNNSKLTLEYLSKDGEEGYPGSLSVRVSYGLTDKNEFVIEYLAETNKATPVNLTNHTYWNLDGRTAGNIYHHLLELKCSEYLDVDEELIPTGRIFSVRGTPLDFLTAKSIGEDIDKLPYGYDHCYLIGSDARMGIGKLVTFANVFSPTSGISMKVSTTMPGVQFYSGNFLRGTFDKHSAFCLETEFYPDSPNKPEFPSCILRPGKIYNHTTVYSFEI